jgi:trimethylamine--corrinoid protein Co-methyltransferase
MIESNMMTLETPFYRRLSESQLQQLHFATLEVMERTGIRFHDEEAVALLKKGGAEVTDGNVVHVPSWRVEWALSISPKQIILYDMDGNPAIRLSGRKSYFGNGSDLPYILDHRTDERRLAVLQDVKDLIRLLDAIPQYDFVMSGFIPSDISPEKAEHHQTMAMLENTHKPMVYVTTNLPNTKDEVEMFEIAAGGADALRRHPYAACYINITHPLRHNPDSIQKLLFLSEKRLPFIYRPSIVTRGLTTPITVAGFLVTNNVAALSGLVLSQLKQEGAPYIRCSCPGGTFDMKTMVGLHSGPEVRGFNEELAHFYGTPCFGLGGSTASKVVDQQAAMDATLNLITSALAGGGLIHDIGYMASSTLGSLIQSAICGEMIAWIKEYWKGLKIDEETLALDVIHEVGTQGDFVETAHSFRHCRDDYYPELSDQKLFEEWINAGGTTMKDRAKAKVEKILAEHQPIKMEASVRKALQKMIEKK